MEEYDTQAPVCVHREAAFWLAPNRGILKLASDGREYEVTGQL